MSSEPLVRARHLKATIAQLLATEEGEAVLGRLPADLLAQVERSYGGDWLPVELDVVLARAIRAGLTPEAHHAFCVATVTSSFEGPLLGALAQAGLAVLGRDVRRLAGWIPKGWHLVFRGVGRWTIRPHDVVPVVHLSLSGLPAVCVADDDWASAAASSMSAICTLARTEGRVTLLAVDRAGGRADYQLGWTP